MASCLDSGVTRRFPTLHLTWANQLIYIYIFMIQTSGWSLSNKMNLLFPKMSIFTDSFPPCRCSYSHRSVLVVLHHTNREAVCCILYQIWDFSLQRKATNRAQYPWARHRLLPVFKVFPTELQSSNRQSKAYCVPDKQLPSSALILVSWTTC